MWVKDPDSLHSKDVEAVFFQLVTPVEEMILYKVNHVKELELFEVCHYEMGDDTIEKEGELYKIVRTIYWYGNKKGDRTEEEARAEAEAERDRLNEEYRKTKTLNQESLCANCRHLVSEEDGDMSCSRRNQINRLGSKVYIVKGFTSCINFERKEEQ